MQQYWSAQSAPSGSSESCSERTSVNASLWTDISNGPMTEEAIRELYPTPLGYRFYPNRYSEGVQFSGVHSREGRMFVFEGGCVYRTEASTVIIHAGEYADLPAGPYEIETLPTSPVRLLVMYKIPQLATRAAESGPNPTGRD